jgi:uncharacterized protein (TIRG00374 family)
VHGSYTGQRFGIRGEKGLSKIVKVIWQWLLALFLLAIGIYYWGLSDVLKVSVVHWPAVGLVFFFTACFTLIHNIRWLSLLRGLLPVSLRKEMDFYQFYQWLMNSYAVGLFVPSDASLVGVRTFFMKQYKDVRTSTALLSVLLDRLFDVIVLIVVIVSAALLFIGNNRLEMLLIPIAMVGLLFSVVLWKNDEVFSFLIKIYCQGINLVLRIPVLKKWKKFEVSEAFQCAPLKRNAICGLMAWSFLKYIFIALRFYAIGLVFGITFTFFDAFFAASLVQLAGFINVTPGGLGIIEMGSYGALKVIGASHPEAVVFVVGQRVLVSCIILALAAMINLLIIARTGILKRSSLAEGR